MPLFKKKKHHTPTVLQMEAAECGAASLGMILGYYGKFVDLAELRRDCGVSRDGSKASKIIKAAVQHGCTAKGFAYSVDQLREKSRGRKGEYRLPAILFWNSNHFVTLEGFGRNEVFINDPASGHRKVGMSEFEAAYSGVVLFIEPGPEFEKGGHRPSARPALLKALKGNYAGLIFAMLSGLILVVPGAALPVATSVFIDSVLVESRTDWFRPLLMFMCGILLLNVVTTGLRLHVSRRFGLAMSVMLNSRFLRHLLRLPVLFYTARYPGEIVGRMSLNDSVASTITGPLAQVVVNLTMMIIYGTILVCFSPLLTGIGVGMILIDFLVLRLVSKKRAEASLGASQEMGRAQGALIAGIQGIETIKAGGQESGFFSKWSGYYAKGQNASTRIQKSTLNLGILPELTGNLTGLLIIMVGGLLIIEGEMSLGSLVAFKALMGKFQGPVGSLFGFMGQFQTLGAQLVRVNDVLLHPTVAEPSGEYKTDETGRPVVRYEGRVEVRGMSFGYSPLEPPLIEDFSLKVEPGRSVALVGGSGSGKSTIAKIICGLYEPREGEVLLDGQKVTDVPSLVLRNTLGFVEQEISIFEGTVRDNLTLWDATVPEEAIVEACESAQIYDVVQNLPGGLDAPLKENGSNLSGGQRQRLELARALVNNPSLVIMDEATSALDAETERLVMINLRRRGCTSIIVAHRLSTIRDCSEIIVLDKGKVVERGSHDELMENDDHYARLVKKTLEEGDSQ